MSEGYQSTGPNPKREDDDPLDIWERSGEPPPNPVVDLEPGDSIEDALDSLPKGGMLRLAPGTSYGLN